MIARWMVATIVVGALLSVAGHLLTPLQTRLGFPRRWLWLGLMLFSTAVPLALALRDGAAAPSHQSANVIQANCCAPTAVATFSDKQVSAGSFDIPLLVAWGLLSLSLAIVLVFAHRRTVLRLRTWKPGVLHGEPVVFAPNFGPAVVGVVRTTVVLPRWVLTLSSHEQTLVLRHELEHVRSGDQFVLLTGMLLNVLMPWNLALWWQLRRLRIAMELDCDARVAPTAIDRPRYAGLLLHARQFRPAQQSALGFVSVHSALAERLFALLDRRDPSRTQLSAWSLSAAACVAMLVQVPVPSVRAALNRAMLSATSVQETDRSAHAVSRVAPDNNQPRVGQLKSARAAVAIPNSDSPSRGNGTVPANVRASRADVASSSLVNLNDARRVHVSRESQNVGSSGAPTVRYDVLLPYDPARLDSIAREMPRPMGARGTPVSAREVGPNAVRGAVDENSDADRVATIRRIGPDSLFLKH